MGIEAEGHIRPHDAKALLEHVHSRLEPGALLRGGQSAVSVESLQEHAGDGIAEGCILAVFPEPLALVQRRGLTDRTVGAVATTNLLLGVVLAAATWSLAPAVADFFHFHWGEVSFYIFNIADVAITFGVLLLILDLIGFGRKKAQDAP